MSKLNINEAIGKFNIIYPTNPNDDVNLSLTFLYEDDGTGAMATETVNRTVKYSAMSALLGPSIATAKTEIAKTGKGGHTVAEAVAEAVEEE